MSRLPQTLKPLRNVLDCHVEHEVFSDRRPWKALVSTPLGGHIVGQPRSLKRFEGNDAFCNVKHEAFFSRRPWEGLVSTPLGGHIVWYAKLLVAQSGGSDADAMAMPMRWQNAMRKCGGLRPTRRCQTNKDPTFGGWE